MDNIFVVIPTLDPEQDIMEEFIDNLKSEFNNILVINDGSKSIYDDFFKKLEKKGVKVIRHCKNFGKGRALKSAFNYLLNEYPNIEGCVTADSDGQHTVKDIKKCAKALLKNPEHLILGVRNFDYDYVPEKSKIGNKITRNIFKIFIGLDISDTQTGLRGTSKELMLKYSDLAGERYEYETNMLITCQTDNIKIDEVDIETIYLNSNVNSHFNPLKDSILIYRLFAKYFMASFSSFLLDIFLFSFLLGMLNISTKILAATILARIVSSIYNYIINSNLVFKDMSIKSLVRYYLLVIIIMFISGCFVTYLHTLLPISIISIKIIVDTIIWVINLVVQREFVFKGGKNNEEKLS